jgi:hypothetical protein
MQDAENGSISGQDPQAYGGDYGEAENERHKKRNHVLTNLNEVQQMKFNIRCHDSQFRISEPCVPAKVRTFNLPALTLGASND